LVAGCEKSTPAAQPSTPPPGGAEDPLAGKPVVRNVEAKTGDVTVCPYSGRKFVVQDDSPRWEYEGKTYVFCAQKALDAVKQDPAKYLANFEG
jgi:YHS domain-containing protein